MRTEIPKKMLALAVLACCLTGRVHAVELRAQIVKECPNQLAKPAPGQKALGAIAAILIPELISAGVDMAATALTEAAKAKTVTHVADSNVFNMYTLNAQAELAFSEEVGCLLVYLPAFKDSREKPAPMPTWFRKVADMEIGGLTDPPDIYVEFEIRGNGSSSPKLVLVPQLLAVSRPMQEGFARKKPRGYVFALTFKDASALASYGAATFAFDDVPVGVWTRDGRGDSKQAQWPLDAAVAKMPENEDVTASVSAQKSKTAPYRSANALLKQQHQVISPVVLNAPPDSIFDPDYVTALRSMCAALDKANAAKAATKVSDERCPADAFVAKRDFARAADKVALKVGAKWANDFRHKKCAGSTVTPDGGLELCKLPEPDASKVGYSQISVSVVETAEASEFVQGLAKAFSSKKEEVKTSLNDRLNPERRDELSAAAATKGTDARNAYRVAILNIQQIEAQSQEASDKPESARATIRTQLAQAKIDANKAAIGAGVAVPYPEFE